MTENEFLREMVKAAGGDPDKLPDRLKSTYYQCLIDCMNKGGGSGEYTQPEWGYKEVNFLPEMEVTLALNEELGVVAGFIDNSLFTTALIPYQEYTVIYGDQEYVCAFDGISLGNCVITGGENTGEPFLFVTQDGLCGISPLNQTPGTVKFGIRGKIYKAIDSKFVTEIPYLDLLDLGFNSIDNINTATINYNEEYFRENIEPQLGKANLKVRMPVMFKSYDFFNLTGGTTITEGKVYSIILHASESDNHGESYIYYTVLKTVIIGVKFTNTSASVALHPFDISAFVLDGEFT